MNQELEIFSNHFYEMQIQLKMGKFLLLGFGKLRAQELKQAKGSALIYILKYLNHNAIMCTQNLT